MQQPETASPQTTDEFWEEATRYMDALYRTALRMTRNAQDAEDLVQETYLKAHRFRDRFAEGTNLRAWLFKILVNSFINLYRRRGHQPQTVPLLEEGDEDFFLYNRLARRSPDGQVVSAEEEALSNLAEEEVVAAIEALPERFRMVVLLSDVEDFSYKEIAEALGLKLGTVMSRLHRGRKMLERSLWVYAQKAGYGVRSAG